MKLRLHLRLMLAASFALIVISISMIGLAAPASAGSTPATPGNFSFAPPAHYDTGYVADFAIGDVNHDNILDIVTIDNSNTAIAYVMLGRGDGTFSVSTVSLCACLPTSIRLGDMNGDGNIDIVVNNQINQQISDLFIYYGDGHGAFSSGSEFYSVLTLSYIRLGDFNHDGWMDIVGLNSNNAGNPNLCVMLNLGNGHFSPTTYTVGSIYSNMEDMLLTDFNGDGNLDLAIPDRSPAGVWIMLGAADGTFGSATQYDTGGAVDTLTAGDFNHDDHIDLALSRGYSNYALVVLLGNGAGGFSSPISQLSGTYPWGIAAADFDGDGNTDIALTTDHDVQALRGSGNGYFTTQVSYPALYLATMRSRDLNGDGAPDLIVKGDGAYYVRGIYIFLNTTNATPTPTPSNTATPTATRTSTPMNTPMTTSTPTNTPVRTGTPVATNTPTNTPPPNPTPTNTSSDPFVDLNGNVFRPAIDYLYNRGVVNGTDATHYSPANPLTRGQFAKVVILAFGYPLSTLPQQPTFSDVPPTYFAYAYIESGYSQGILNGYDATTCHAAGAAYPCYLPNRALSRGQLTKLVVNAGHFNAYTPTTPSFVDVPTSNIFYVSIETAHHLGIINGYADHTFKPNNNIRRDEMAQAVYKAITLP